MDSTYRVSLLYFMSISSQYIKLYHCTCSVNTSSNVQYSLYYPYSPMSTTSVLHAILPTRLMQTYSFCILSTIVSTYTKLISGYYFDPVQLVMKTMLLCYQNVAETALTVGKICLSFLLFQALQLQLCHIGEICITSFHSRFICLLLFNQVTDSSITLSLTYTDVMLFVLVKTK